MTEAELKIASQTTRLFADYSNEYMKKQYTPPPKDEKLEAAMELLQAQIKRLKAKGIKFNYYYTSDKNENKNI